MSDRRKIFKEFILAEKTSVGGIGRVGRVVEFVGIDRPAARVQAGRDGKGRSFFLFRKRRADRGHGQDIFATERFSRSG